MTQDSITFGIVSLSQPRMNFISDRLPVLMSATVDVVNYQKLKNFYSAARAFRCAVRVMTQDIHLGLVVICFSIAAAVFWGTLSIFTSVFSYTLWIILCPLAGGLSRARAALRLKPIRAAFVFDKVFWGCGILPSALLTNHSMGFDYHVLIISDSIKRFYEENFLNKTKNQRAIKIVRVEQKHAYGCAVACIAMILGVDYDEIEKTFCTDFNRDGIKPLIVRNYVCYHGFAVIEKQAGNFMDVRSSNRRMTVPFADVHIFNAFPHADAKHGHSFIVDSKGKIYDPSPGHEVASFEDYYEIYSVMGFYKEMKDEKASRLQSRKRKDSK